MKQFIQSLQRENPWELHGFVFSIAAGISFASLSYAFVALMEYPDDVPLRDVLAPVDAVVFLALAMCAFISYVGSMLASVLVLRMKRSILVKVKSATNWFP